VIMGGHAGVMAEQPDPRVKNPFAIPSSALYGDGATSHDQLVTVQPHQAPNDWAPAGADGPADGDGD